MEKNSDRKTMPGNAGYSRELRERAVQLVAAGQPKNQVAAQLQVGTSTIEGWTKHIKLIESYSPEFKHQAVQRVISGMTAAKVGRELGVDGSLIATWVRLVTGIKKQEAKTYSDEVRERAVKLVESGRTMAEVAREINATPATINNWFGAALAAGKVKKPPISIKRDDTNLGWVVKDYPQLESWRVLAVNWLKGEPMNLSKKLNVMAAFLVRYVVGLKLPTEPNELLRRGTILPDFYQTVCVASAGGIYQNNAIHHFLNWVLLSEFSDRGDDGNLLVSSEFRNPIPYRSSAGLPSLYESVHSPLPYAYIDELRRMLAQGTNFCDWTWAQSALGVKMELSSRHATDWFEVAEDQIDKKDQDCVWRLRERVSAKPVLEMWSPVRWVALLLKLQLPLRTFQVRMLDSGEADTWRYDAGKWSKNNGHLAQGRDSRPLRQGVFRRADGQQSDAVSTLLYINTNKTADATKSGKDKGYDIPWPVMGELYQQPHYWLEKLRNWQEKYNAIKCRTSWKELRSRHMEVKSEVQLSGYPDACFLFRCAESKDDSQSHLPITDGNIDTGWFRLLQALQSKLAADNETHADGSPIQLVDSDSYISKFFPLHGLRVSLVTALALEGQVPFSILQKLVGHSRLLMTLYYTKPGTSRMESVLFDAGKRLDATKEKSIISFLKDTEHKQLIKEAICNNAESFSAAVPQHPANRNPAGWMPMHHGLCLVGGNTSELEGNCKIGGCYNGGPMISGAKSKAYSPVPGGARNCVRCRWFVTEPRYVPALSAHLNTLAYHFDEARNTCIKQNAALQHLKKEKADSEKSLVAFEKQPELLTAERVWETAMTRFSGLAEDLGACWRLIARCQAAPTGDSSNSNTMLIAAGTAMDVHIAFEETESELLQLAGVCESFEVYPDLEPGKAIFRRSQLLDTALRRDNLPPVFMCLSEEEQLKAGNSFMRQLSLQMAPQNPSLGIRRVCGLIDAGLSLAEYMGVELGAFLPGGVEPEPVRPLIKLKEL